MKNHLSQEHINVLKQCINAYEECITECQKLISSCAADRADMCLISCNNTDIEDCAKHCGKTVAASHKVITISQKAIDFCKAHLNNCKERGCVNYCNELIAINEQCMDIAAANEELCSVGNEKCINSCLEFIKKAQKAININLTHIN